DASSKSITELKEAKAFYYHPPLRQHPTVPSWALNPDRTKCKHLVSPSGKLFSADWHGVWSLDPISGAVTEIAFDPPGNGIDDDETVDTRGCARLLHEADGRAVFTTTDSTHLVRLIVTDGTP